MCEIEREIGSVGEAQVPPARLTKLLQQAVAFQVRVRTRVTAVRQRDATRPVALCGTCSV